MAPRLFLAACVALCACIALSHAQQADPKRPVACQKRQERFVAYISGQNNVAPNSTTPKPNPTPVNGLMTLCIDNTKQRGDWTLVACNFTQATEGYIASHLHVGSNNVDFAPPLVPTLLPGSTPQIFSGCREEKGSFTQANFLQQPPSKLPTVEPVTTWNKFVSKLQAGDIYVNVHSKRLPLGEARGNLYPQ